MIVAGFEITNSKDRTQWFEETFFIADIPQLLVLGITFLKLENLNVSCTACIMDWRQWDAEITFMTIYRVELIEPENFIQQVLEESAQAYLCHVIMIEASPHQVHLS